MKNSSIHKIGLSVFVFASFGCHSNKIVPHKGPSPDTSKMIHNPIDPKLAPRSGSNDPTSPEIQARVRSYFQHIQRATSEAGRLEIEGELEGSYHTLATALQRAPKIGNQNGRHIVSSVADPLGRVLVKLGRAKDAITILEDSSKISGDVRQSLGIAYFEAGDLDKAREFYDEQAILLYGPWEQATEDLPGQHGRSALGASLYLARANTFLVSAQLELAEDDLVRAKELCPQNALVLYILGDHYEGQKKWDQARACLVVAKAQAKSTTLKSLLGEKNWAFR